MKDPLSDFRNFLYLIWKFLNLPSPTPVQYDLAVYLQHSPERAVIEAFRGAGKSWLTSAYVCWNLYQNPQTEIMVVSASKTRADDFSTFVLRLIHEVPELAHLRPKKDQRNSKIAFEVGPKRASHSPSVKSVGITGQLTGSRADLIVVDDVEIPNNSATQMMRDKLSEAVKEFDAVLKPGGRIIYLGTPQTEQSLYNKLPERGYVVRIWPALIPTEEEKAAYGDRLAPMISALDRPAGKPVDPVRFNEEDLLKRLASFGRSGFALQFMLDTRLSDASRYPLKVSDLLVMSCDRDMAPIKQVWAADPDTRLDDLPNMAMDGDRFYRPLWKDKHCAPWTGSVMAIDPSGRGSDETTYAIVKILHGYLFVTACGGLPGGYAEKTLHALAAEAAAHRVNHVVVEANFGDGMFTELLKPVLAKIHPCQVEEVKHSRQKEARIIDTLEPVMNQHRLVVDPEVIRKDFDSIQSYPLESQRHYSLIYQMTRITRERGALVHDDRLDALAMAVAYWTDRMAVDSDKQKAQWQEKEWQKALNAFVRGARGMCSVRNPRWCLKGR